MAYINTQLIENLKVQNLIFISNNNNPIPIGYSLYMGPNGRTYWDQAFNNSSFTNFSTDVYTYINDSLMIVQDDIDTLTANVNTISQDLQQLTNTLEVLSTNIRSELTSTYQGLISTLYSFSSFSTFYVELSSLQLAMQSNVSTLSTTIVLTNASTYNSLSSSIQNAYLSSILYTNASISTLSSGVQISQSSAVSLLTFQLTSSISSLTNYVNAKDALLFDSIQVLNLATQQNAANIQSQSNQITALQTTSTNMSTVVNGWISSYVQADQAKQTIEINNSISTLSSTVYTNKISSDASIMFLSSLISTNTQSIAVLNIEVASLNTQMIELSGEVSTLVETGLPSSLYASFDQLSNYTYELLTTMYDGTLVYQSTLASTTIVQCQSVASVFFTEYVSSLYISSISVTTAYFNMQISTLFSTLTSTIYYETTSTVSIYINSTIPVLLSTAISTSLTGFETDALAAYNEYLSSLAYSYTSNQIYLNSANPRGTMNFSSFRNYEVFVQDIYNTVTPIGLTYDPALLTGLDYVRGYISIHISTPTMDQTYTLNDGKLQFDVYRWGIPTTIWGNVYPTISNQQYTIMYEYMILRKTVYANLLAVYPLLYVSTVAIVQTSPGLFAVAWTSYNGFYAGSALSPPFDPNTILTISSSGYSQTIFNLPMNSEQQIFINPSFPLPYTFTIHIAGQTNTAYAFTSTIY